ncbi:MAG: GDSL-type esterase/lipase family protein [Chloroflexota bacterium]
MKGLILILCFLALARGVQAQEMPDAQVMSDTTLRLRAAPTTESDILRILPPATPLMVLGVSLEQDWLNVQIPEGLVGWVSAEYVEMFIDLATAFPNGGEVHLSDDVVAHIRQVYAAGQARGNTANVFAKVGDSITVSTLTLHPLGVGLYELGDYGYLRSVIDFYAAGETRDGHNSFNEESVAAGIGWTTYRVLDPLESDPAVCLTDESPLLCEYRLLKPSVALIMFGTNDVSILEAQNFRANLERIVQLSEGQGIIPVLTTIPDRVDYEARSRDFNRIISDVARENAIPLLDYGGAMLALGEAGFDLDGVHPSVPPKGFDGAADFREGNLGYGYVVRNLTALQVLDAIWRVTAGA